MIQKKIFKNAIVVASDKNYQIFLPWWFSLYKKHNNYPVMFCDFVDYDGMTQEAVDFCKKYGTYIKIEGKRKHIWLMKTLAMISAPAENIVWIDVDCQIKGNIKGIFEYCNKFGVCKEENQDALPNGEPQWGKWQCGVIATNTSNPILAAWEEENKKEENLNDQYNLWKTCSENKFKVNVMPVLFNWTYYMLYNKDCLIKHWTGPLKRKVKIMLSQKPVGFDYNFSSIVVDLDGGIKV